IRDDLVTGVQTCALPIYGASARWFVGMPAGFRAGSLPGTVGGFFRRRIAGGVRMDGRRLALRLAGGSRNVFGLLGGARVRASGEIGRASCRDRGLIWVGR